MPVLGDLHAKVIVWHDHLSEFLSIDQFFLENEEQSVELCHLAANEVAVHFHWHIHFQVIFSSYAAHVNLIY